MTDSTDSSPGFLSQETGAFSVADHSEPSSPIFDSFIDHQLIPGGIRFRLPPRRLKRAKLIGLALTAVGAAGCLVSSRWVLAMGIQAIGFVRNGAISLAAFTLALAFFGSPVFWISVRMLWFAQAVLRNATGAIVDVAHGRLQAHERFLSRRWFGTAIALDQVRKLVIESEIEPRRGRRPAVEWELRLAGWIGVHPACLMVVSDKGRRFPLVNLYDETMLAELARELNRQAGLDLPLERPSDRVTTTDTDVSHATAGGSEGNLTEWNESIAAAGAGMRPSIDTRISIEQREDGITVEVPPLGWRRAPKYLWLFTAVWLVICIALGIGFVVSLFGQNAPGNAAPNVGVDVAWIAAAVWGGLLAIGIGLCLFGFSISSRRTTLATADDSLLVVEFGLWRKRSRQWQVHEIESIGIGKFDQSDEHHPAFQVDITLISGKRHSVLKGVRFDEAKWVAVALERALKLDVIAIDGRARHDAVVRDDTGHAIPGPRSKLMIERSVHRLRIDVLSKGFGRHAIFCLVMVAFAAAALVLAHQSWEQWRNPRAAANVSAGLFLLAIALVLLVVAVVGIVIYLVDATRRYEIVADGDQLRIDRRDLFLRRHVIWKARQLRSLRVVQSGIRVNDRPLCQVRIRVKNGTSVDILAGHARLDLHTVAVAINEFYGLE